MSGSFEIFTTEIKDLLVLQRVPHKDDRGHFERLFCEKELESVLRGRKLIQINHSQTLKKGVIRGMHFQYPPYAEMKLISCLYGEIFDVAVDLREESLTYLQWHGEILSENNYKTMVIPEGFAHGFQVLSDKCGLVYFHTNCYNQNFEDGLNPMDKKLAIRWPIAQSTLSTRDELFPKIENRSVKVPL